MANRTKITRWRNRKLKLHPFCHWCGCRVYPPFPGKPHSNNTATVDHLRSRLDPDRLAPLTPMTMQRRVLACHKCNNLRSKEECVRLVEIQRMRSGNLGLSVYPYPQRRKRLAALKTRAESGIQGLVSVMGSPEVFRQMEGMGKF